MLVIIRVLCSQGPPSCTSVSLRSSQQTSTAFILKSTPFEPRSTSAWLTPMPPCLGGVCVCLKTVPLLWMRYCLPVCPTGNLFSEQHRESIEIKMQNSSYCSLCFYHKSTIQLVLTKEREWDWWDMNDVLIFAVELASVKAVLLHGKPWPNGWRSGFGAKRLPVWCPGPAGRA